jgi:hypothetical protein
MTTPGRTLVEGILVVLQLRKFWSKWRWGDDGPWTHLAKSIKETRAAFSIHDDVTSCGVVAWGVFGLVLNP